MRYTRAHARFPKFLSVTSKYFAPAAPRMLIGAEYLFHCTSLGDSTAVHSVDPAHSTAVHSVIPLRFTRAANKMQTPSTRAAAKLPNRMAGTLSFYDLTPTALKVFLYAVHMRERNQSRVAVFNWHALAEYLSPDAKMAVQSHDYRLLSQALEQLVNVQVSYSHKDAQSRQHIKERYNLLAGWTANMDTGSVVIDFHDKLGRVLDILLEDQRDFTMLPLADVLALDNARQIRVLMWAAQFAGFNHESMRQLGLGDLRRALGLLDPYYDQWSRVRDVLLKHARKVSSKTSFQIALAPVKSGRQVTALQFNVQRRK